MMRLLSKKRGRKALLGQSTLEYAILVVVVIMALIAIQAYLKRSIEGRQREAADQIGEQFSTEHTTYNYQTQTYAAINEEEDAYSTTSTIKDQWTSRKGWEVTGNFQDEYQVWE